MSNNSNNNNNNNDATWRSLNKQELTCLDRLFAKYKLNRDISAIDPSLLVRYQKMQGGFTIAIIRNDKGNMFVGCSRRSYRDHNNSIRGQMLAFRRAAMYSQAIPV